MATCTKQVAISLLLVIGVIGLKYLLRTRTKMNVLNRHELQMNE